MMRTFIFTLVTLAFLALDAFAWPNCKEAVASAVITPESSEWFKSILLMVSLPVLMVGGTITTLVVMTKNAEAKQAEEDQAN